MARSGSNRRNGTKSSETGLEVVDEPRPRGARTDFNATRRSSGFQPGARGVILDRNATSRPASNARASRCSSMRPHPRPAKRKSKRRLSAKLCCSRRLIRTVGRGRIGQDELDGLVEVRARCGSAQGLRSKSSPADREKRRGARVRCRCRRWSAPRINARERRPYVGAPGAERIVSRTA